MKSLILLLALGFLHIHLAGTKALLAVFDDVVKEGQSYPVEWLSDAEDYLRLWLVLDDGSGWRRVQTLFDNVTSKEPGGNYTWHVDTNLTAGSGYGLWLSSTPVAPNATTGYADLSDWFNITWPNGSMPSPTSSHSPTTSASGSTFTLPASATATGLGSTSPGDITPQQNNSLSKGAIIGIAVGVSLGVVALLIIGAIFILRRRRKARAAELSADAKRFSVNGDPDDMVKPSFVPNGTPAELPEDPKVQRAEIPGQSRQPQEKDAGDEVPELKTIPPDKPVELE